MLKAVVSLGNSLLGEVEIYPQNNQFIYYMKEIKVGYFSQPSERCPPLAVLHTIAPSAMCFKLESRTLQSNEPLFALHGSCLRDNKTAVVPFHNEEIHLVAMPSRRNVTPYACFWGFAVAPKLYKSCLNMLNLRCLGIVFDLDETLVVAHTLKTIDDRVNAVNQKLDNQKVDNDIDGQRVSGMLAEIKRLREDKFILSQYIENDQVVDNGKVIKVQPEVVPALAEDREPTVRPIIRLHEKNIILTRITPENPDTSVLVRLRPSWEDLRSYLIARGRKRFEVYVCTMADKDYALEMWRLLDPDSNLINSKELLERIVCVKSGSKKSLLNVFHDGNCHPKMALVIDDRLKVWDEKDQPRVHVVPAFAPHYAPQAEANNVIPVLCVARNVACNVRGGFFKDFDDGLLQRISDVSYEDDLAEIPSAPDVSNYLVSEDDLGASNKEPLGIEGSVNAEFDRKLKDTVSSSSMLNALDPRQAASLLPAAASIFSTLLQPTIPVIPAQTNPFPLAISSAKPLVHVGPVEPSLQGSPAREEGEVPESELDPDTRRRLLILQHGQDTREQTSSEPPFPVRPPLQVSIPQGNPHGMWPPLEEKISSRQQNQVVPKPIPKEVPLVSDTKHFDKHAIRRPPFLRGAESSVSSDRYLHENPRSAREGRRRDDRFRPNHPIPKRRPFPVSRDEEMQLDPPIPKTEPKTEEDPANALQTIAKKCRTTVEFKSIVVSSIKLQFSIEVWFNGEKMGEAVHRTRKQAQRVASEHALRNLSNKYLSDDPKSTYGNKILDTKENGFRGDSNSPGYQTALKEGLGSSKSEPPNFVDPRSEDSKRLTSSVSELKELCLAEGLALDIQDQSPLPVNPKLEGEFHAQVQIGGQVFGKGIGSTWDEAKIRAAEEALESVKSMIGQGAQGDHSLPRSPIHSSRRQKVDYSQVLQRIPSSLKYSNNTSPVS